MRRALWFISTIPILSGHPPLVAQVVTSPTPRSQTGSGTGTQPPPSRALPDLDGIPFAVPLKAEDTDHISAESDLQSEQNGVYLLSGDVVIHFRNRTIFADSVQLNKATGVVVAQGHLRITNAENNESIQASHGTYNLKTGLGEFYDAAGSVGLRNPVGLRSQGVSRNPVAEGSPATLSPGLETANPFLFTGRLVQKTGPEDFTIYDGTVTSCALPKPDWLFSARKIVVAGAKAHASNSTFHLMSVPVLFLPYVTAPTTTGQRQSGLLIPVFGDSSTKGITVGEQAYIVLGRSADLTAGTVYYSLRGFSESGTFRYRGPADGFITAHFSALQDRGYVANNGVYVNQGGEDFTAAFRRQLSPNTRAVGDGEYLSSYIYREAFTDSFNQAVSSDITSIGYVTHQTDGWSVDGRVDRYQGLKRVPIGSTPGQQVHILHVPSFDLDGLDRPIAGTPLVWSLDSSLAGLKRVQPNFTSSGIVQRFDLRPELSLPLHFGGWNVLGSLATRETVYSRSRQAPYGAGAAPVELTQAVNRADLEMEVAIRPPVLERTFAVPRALGNLFGTEVRHTLEPEVTYRDVKGVDNFLSVLRFDDTDVVSDTNQLEYGITQHLYFRPKPKKTAVLPAGCPADVNPASVAGERAKEGDFGDLRRPGEQSPTPEATAAAQENLAEAAATVPDVLTPSAGDSTDANGIAVPSSAAPDLPLRTHARHLSRCSPPVQTAQQPWASWRLTQRYFFDPTFGHAVIQNRRNIFESTLSLSGIAFLTEPRSISPLVSRLRVRTSEHTDVEWDFDYDTGATKFTSSNVFLDAHEGPVFGGLSYARLNAPGRFATEVIDTNNNPSLVNSAVSNFSQIRLLLGYGVPAKPGLSVATNVGLDALGGAVQYAALQTSYNWNCCGLAVEYRKFDLGTVRDENSYRFSFTLANIGSAGNIRRTERLF